MLLRPARHREDSAEADGQFGILTAQHCMNHFTKVAKIARKRLFTIEHAVSNKNFHSTT